MSKLSRYRVRILTRNGPLWIWPHEYNVVDSISDYIENGAKINYLTSEASVPEAQLFYIRTRGISKGDALVMLIGEVKEQTFCYLTFPKEFQIEFAGVGVPGMNGREHVM